MVGKVKESRLGLSVAGLLLGAALLALTLRQFDLSEAWRQVTSIAPGKLILPILISLAAIPVRPWRWQAMFERTQAPQFITATRAFYISLLLNNILPARGGDVLRCFLAHREPSLRNAGRTLGTLAVEKTLDGLAVLSVVTVSMLFLDLSPWLERLAAISGVLLGFGFFVLWSLQRRPAACNKAASAFCRLIRSPSLGAKIELLFDSLAEGLSAVGSASRMTWLLCLTALLWSLEGAVTWSLASAMNLDLSFAGGTLTVAVLGLGMMAPAAPGFVGTYEFFSTAILTTLGIPPEKALGLTLFMHAWFLLVTTGVGSIALASGSMSLSRLLAVRHTPILPEHEHKGDLR